MEIAHPNDIESCSTWLEIDLAALKNNIRQLRDISKTEIMPVVKANAYGHGLLEVSRAAEEEGVTWLGVSRIEEAISLRNAGIRCSILILGYTSPPRIPEAIENNVTVTLYDPCVAAQYNEAANGMGNPLRVHVKTDSGMGRLGIPTAEAEGFMEQLVSMKNLKVDGLFTHFARADEPEAATTSEQLERFQILLNALARKKIRPPLIHASNSAGGLNFPPARFDLIRCGIAVYGLNPSPQTHLPTGFQRALSWKTRLTSVKTLPKGHGVSYGFHYYTPKEERIGVIAIGYADGFRRVEGNHVLIRGKTADVVGAVCMDQCMVRLDEIPDAEVGDEVVLIGAQGEKEILADDLALGWQTINYEVVCGLADRVPRFYRS
jgi:alanine racemase